MSDKVLAALALGRGRIADERRGVVDSETTPDANEWRDESAMREDAKKLVAEIDRDLAVIDEAIASYCACMHEAQLRRKWYWFDDDGENPGDDPSEVMDYWDIRCGEVVKIGCGQELTPLWAVRVAETWDADGDPENTRVLSFGSEAEANSAAARARLARDG